MNRIVIAIDGPAQAGKGTLARKLAKYFGFIHVDSGAIYRAAVFHALMEGLDPEDGSDVAFALSLMPPSRLNEPGLRTEEIAKLTAKIAPHSEVREAANAFQYKLVAFSPRGAVVEGRDICTKVFPEAPFKFYLTASSQVRAERRLHALGPNSGAVLEELKMAIEARDHADSTREIDPLVRHPDACLIDSSELGVEEVFNAALSSIGDRIAKH